MNSKAPIVQQIAWISLVPHLIVMGLLMLIWYQFNQTEYILFGALTYLIISLVLRRSIANEHRKGVIKVKVEDYDHAIAHFQNSYEFFKKNLWIDEYRFLTLLSSGRMSYREMALVNIAFCYGQLGNGNLSKEFYEKTLEEFPENGMAKAGLRMLNSMLKEDK